MKKEYVITSMMINRGGEDMEVDIDGYVHYDVDTRYGEDADGYRSSVRTTVEDVSGVDAWDVYGHTVSLTDKEYQEAEQILTDKFLQG